MQRDVQELPQAQRIGGSPRHRPLRVQALDIAQQQHPDVPARRQTRPADPVGVERRALLLDEGIEAGVVEHTIQSLVERVAPHSAAGPYWPPTSTAAPRDCGVCPLP